MGRRVSRSTRPRDLGVLPELTLEEIADREAENGLRQFDRTVELIAAAASPAEFRLRPSTLLELNLLAVTGLEPGAGQYRQESVEISNSVHVPPPSQEVPRLVEDMCDYVNERFTEDQAMHLAAYVMWRLNWIHPFPNGNGRTSRVVSYLVLCAALGFRLPGAVTVPAFIAADKAPYYHALDLADAAWRGGEVDVSAMEELMSRLLQLQLET